MSKWSKPQGVVVPLESLLKERRKENCPAPRRSAGLVGRWGITSFTSIRNRNYVVDYSNVNPKDPGLELGSGAGDSPEGATSMLGSPVAEAGRPRKFFKSRNTVLPPPMPPGDHHLHAGFGPHHTPFEAVQGVVPGDGWNHSIAAPPSHFYQQHQPLSAATPQLSPTGPQSANIGGLQHAVPPEGMVLYGIQQQAPLLAKEKAPRRKKLPVELAGRKPTGRHPGKKEKKERKPKRSKKAPIEAGSAGGAGSSAGASADAQESQPKRNSSRIRNRVVNYNEEEEDSNDFDKTRVVPVKQQSPLDALEQGIPPVANVATFATGEQQREQEQQQDPHVSTAGSSSFRSMPMENSPRAVSSGDVSTEPLYGAEGRYCAKPTTTTICPPMPSPSTTEHRPILLRISKGTSMLITDNEELPNYHQQHNLLPGQDGTLAEAEVNSSDVFASALTTPAPAAHQKPFRHYHEQHQDQLQSTQPITSDASLLPMSAQAAGFPSPGLTFGGSGADLAPPKTELKIKISLGGKPLISSTTSGGSVTTATNPAIGGKGGSKSSSKYNFKKRAIERERARHHLSSKRSKHADVTGNVVHHNRTIEAGGEGERSESGRRWMTHSGIAIAAPLPPPPPGPVSSSSMSSPSHLQQQRQQSMVASSTLDTIAGGAPGNGCGTAVPPMRQSFPLPGTDTYEVFRTLSSLSGGDDFDSQSSILGSASSDNNTPKHTLLPPGEDCQIIHSRGSSDCGSDLELSQNSSTAAAPPSDVYSESENTQDINHHHQQQQQLLNAICSTPPVVAVASSRTSSTLASTAEVVSTSMSSEADQRQPREGLKLNITHAPSKTNDASARRVTRNKMKHSSDNLAPTMDEQKPSVLAAKQIHLKEGRMVRNRNNNNVVGSTVSEKRPRKQLQPVQERQRLPVIMATVQQGSPMQDAVEQAAEAAHTMQLPPTQADDANVLRTNAVASPVATTGRAGTAALASASSQTAAAPGLKPAVTRQYSRKKKNVVPSDYLAAADTTGGLSIVSDIDMSVSASTSNHELLDVGTTDGPTTVEQQRWQNGTISGRQLHRAQSSNNDDGEHDDAKRSEMKVGADEKTSMAAASTTTTCSSPLPTSVPTAPMRLILQKKGTIFKSRPLVGSSDGATDTKKRHVYKHKWDDDGVGSSDQSGGGGGVAGVGGATGGDGGVNDGTTCGSAGGVIVVSSSGGGCSGVSSNSTDSGALVANHHPASDGGRGDATGTDDVDGCANGVAGAPGASGASLIEYENDFVDSDSAPGLAGMGPRSKRLRTGPSVLIGGSSGSAAATSIAGSVGSGAGGLGGSTSCFTTAGVGAIGHHQHHHHYGHEYDLDSAGYGEDRPDAGGSGADEYGAVKTRCDRNAKPFYTIVRNVKNSHQMQEIGEFQEMDDDVEYILSALQPDNPVSTRCLSALQLATKCMKPAFKMHVRAHGVVTRFFKALSDSYRDASLGLCTAAIMYVFSQDKLNMDLDRDSLELMLNLLDTTDRSDTVSQQQGLGQLQKIRQRVKELCEEIKGVGRAKHIDIDHVTAGSLAMESLLSLTSQRAGEWFKDELRNLGGIEHLIKTVAECYERVPALANDWNGEVVAKLRKIERCLRVLNNVSLFNRQNQRFLLEHREGLLVQMLVKLYRQLDMNLMRYPTNDASPKESTGAVLRELLQPILHMLITLTHSFDEEAYGAHLVGKQPNVIGITMHLLLRIAEHVPHRCVFDLHLLLLTLLLHLARPSRYNRQQVLLYKDENTERGGIKALVEYFEEQEVMASHAEAKTNAILETPARAVSTEDAETKLMQKAEHHMEHTYMGSHVSMLIYHLVLDESAHEQLARTYLKNNNFIRMVAALSRYFEFLNLTTNADAESTAHKRQTKEAIDYLSRLDGCAAGIARSSSDEQMALSYSAVE